MSANLVESSAHRADHLDATDAPAADAARPRTQRPDDVPQLLVVTPWYPTPDNAYAGAFVRESVRSLRPYYDDVLIIHVEHVQPDDTREPRWSRTDEGRVLWIPLPMDPMTSRGQMMLDQRRVLTEHALAYLEHAPLVHAHVGAPTGAALAPLVSPDARLVITEHATYLPKVFRDPLGRELYEAAVRRADVVTAVSKQTAWLLQVTFPDLVDHVTVVANPVPLQNLPLKSDLTSALSRWLYVGNLYEHKGVRRLVRSFAQWVVYTRDEHARLTIVGDGPLREELEALAADLDVADRVDFRGRVEPDRIGEVYVEHDVLVHLSLVETFGLTCVEAAACGLPVVVVDSGAPTDTLVVHHALGLAQFVPQPPADAREDVEPVMEALARLQRSINPDNVRMSRHHLQRVFGADTIGTLLHDALSGQPQTAPKVHEGMRVLAIALNRQQARSAEAALVNFAHFGGGGIYLTAVRPRTLLPPSVQVVDISGIEATMLASRLERLLVLRAPGTALRALGKAARAVSSVLPSVGGPASEAVAGLQSRHREAARHFRYEGLYADVWRNVGPWYTARQLEAAGTLQALDLSQVDCVVLSDEYVTPIAVRALRLNDDLDVRSRWPRPTIARMYAERVLSRAVSGVAPGDDVVVQEVQEATGEALVSAGDSPAAARADNIRS